MPDTFQNVVLGLFLLIVMIFFRNTEELRSSNSNIKIFYKKLIKGA